MDVPLDQVPVVLCNQANGASDIVIDTGKSLSSGDNSPTTPKANLPFDKSHLFSRMNNIFAKGVQKTIKEKEKQKKKMRERGSESEQPKKDSNENSNGASKDSDESSTGANKVSNESSTGANKDSNESSTGATNYLIKLPELSPQPKNNLEAASTMAIKSIVKDDNVAAAVPENIIATTTQATASTQSCQPMDTDDE